MKICPVGAVLFLVDSWTDMTKLIVAFLNANTPKNRVLFFKHIWKWYSECGILLLFRTILNTPLKFGLLAN